MTAVTFVKELPAEGNRAHSFKTSAYWDSVAEQLRSRPGEWASLDLTPDRRYRTADVLTRRLVRHGDVEFAARQGILYVRFIPAARA